MLVAIPFIYTGNLIVIPFLQRVSGEQFVVKIMLIHCRSIWTWTFVFKQFISNRIGAISITAIFEHLHIIGALDRHIHVYPMICGIVWGHKHMRVNGGTVFIFGSCNIEVLKSYSLINVGKWVMEQWVYSNGVMTSTV